MTPIAEVRIPIQLDKDKEGRWIQRSLVFDANTCVAYDDVSGKFYWDTIARFFAVYSMPELRPTATVVNAKGISVPTQAEASRIAIATLRHVPSKDVLQMAWAALHEYDKMDNPVWPLTLSQLGRLVKPVKMAGLMAMLVNGHSANSPDKDELGEASGAGPVLVPTPAEATQSPAASGGAPSTGLPADAFDDPSEKLAG